MTNEKRNPGRSREEALSALNVRQPESALDAVFDRRHYPTTTAQLTRSALVLPIARRDHAKEIIDTQRERKHDAVYTSHGEYKKSRDGQQYEFQVRFLNHIITRDFLTLMALFASYRPYPFASEASDEIDSTGVEFFFSLSGLNKRLRKGGDTNLLLDSLEAMMESRIVYGERKKGSNEPFTKIDARIIEAKGNTTHDGTKCNYVRVSPFFMKVFESELGVHFERIFPSLVAISDAALQKVAMVLRIEMFHKEDIERGHIDFPAKEAFAKAGVDAYFERNELYKRRKALSDESIITAYAEMNMRIDARGREPVIRVYLDDENGKVWFAKLTTTRKLRTPNRTKE